jgi:hypothetical protein
VQTAARDYTRAFLDSFRRGTSSLRQVAPIDLQFDRFGEVARFRRDTWDQLHKQARARSAVAQAIDGSPIAESLGVKTTQNAATLLQLSALEPMQSFVAARAQPGGGVLVTREDIDQTLASAGSTMTSLSGAYAVTAAAVDQAQQEATEKSDGDTPKDDEKLSKFEQAIKDAEKKQKELDDVLKKATRGVKGTFAVLSFAAGQFGDDDLAKSISEYGTVLAKMIDATREFADDAIQVAKVIAKLDDVTADQVLLGAAVGFNFAMIAVVVQMSGLFAKEKPVTQVILEQLKEVRKQIVQLRDEMRVRFDRIETQLNKVFVGILNRLAEIDFELGQIAGNVDELQLALYDLHSEVQRLNRNIQGFLEAANRRELVEAINGFLRFRERTGEDLSLGDFRTAENRFFSWGHDHAKDALQAGLEQRSFTDEDVVEEITAVPLATNINYLRAFPAERFDLNPLSPARLANPFDWIVAGEAYAQLHEESPARTESPARVQALIEVGEALATGLSRIADSGIFDALATQYLASFAALRDAIAAFEQHFRVDPETQLQGVDLFGGVDQKPATHPLDASFQELRRCDGRKFDPATGTDTVPVLPSIGSGFDYSILRPYLIASNLSRSTIPGVADGLAPLTACVVARWTVQSSSPAPGNKVRVTYRLDFAVNINYGTAIVFTHAYRTTETLQLLAPKDKFENGTFDPATAPGGKDPHGLLVGDKKLWLKLDTFEATHGLVNAPLRAATVTLLEKKLVLLQRVFYARVAGGFARAGDPIQRAGTVLTGAKLLWQAFVTAGLPVRIETNDVLRSLLFGSGAILAGSDEDSEDSLLDDVQDLYAFFGGRPDDPPPTNIAADVEALATGRASRLSALLAEIVADIKKTGEPEPPEIFAPTLLRLRLIIPG